MFSCFLFFLRQGLRCLAGFDKAVTKSDLELLIFFPSTCLLTSCQINGVLGLELRASDCWVSIDQLTPSLALQLVHHKALDSPPKENKSQLWCHLARPVKLEEPLSLEI